MKFTQIRNATMTLSYGGKTLLIDPMFAEKGSFPAFPNTPNDHLRNPLVRLPVSVGSLVDADAVVVTHTHIDHWDESAANALPKDVPIFVQHDGDAKLIESQGFTRISVLSKNTKFGDITLSKTGGQHGTDATFTVPELAEGLGEVCGVVFQHAEEKTVYIAGDTVWNHHVEDALDLYQPDVVILNAGFAQAPPFGGIIMGKEDVQRVHERLKKAIIIATHMEAVNHCILSRRELRGFIEDRALQNVALVPEDGESYEL